MRLQQIHLSKEIIILKLLKLLKQPQLISLSKLYQKEQILNVVGAAQSYPNIA